MCSTWVHSDGRSELLQTVENMTRALADENRGRTLLALRKGELCVCQITERTPRKRPRAISFPFASTSPAEDRISGGRTLTPRPRAEEFDLVFPGSCHRSSNRYAETRAKQSPRSSNGQSNRFLNGGSRFNSVRGYQANFPFVFSHSPLIPRLIPFIFSRNFS